MNIKRTMGLAALAAAAAMLAAGCNTVEGFGQDLKQGSASVGKALGKAGDAISNTAERVAGKDEAASEEKGEAAAK